MQACCPHREKEWEGSIKALLLALREVQPSRGGGQGELAIVVLLVGVAVVTPALMAAAAIVVGLTGAGAANTVPALVAANTVPALVAAGSRGP